MEESFQGGFQLWMLLGQVPGNAGVRHSWKTFPEVP